MVTSSQRMRAATVDRDKSSASFPWLELALCVCIATLLAQLIYLDLLSGIASVLLFLPGGIDVRLWTWRSCAVICAVTIVALVFVRHMDGR